MPERKPRENKSKNNEPPQQTGEIDKSKHPCLVQFFPPNLHLQFPNSLMDKVNSVSDNLSIVFTTGLLHGDHRDMSAKSRKIIIT
ncbi:hypothetical protein I7I50_06350 [Histoplasma capsulatum G186AR]|nr:hypothetical protein I7I52_10577 [Histoplasma capsulatum]QSS67316.1 hypothetical protein I7I50_06350 [Histoplasma capsulatum G186AR]